MHGFHPRNHRFLNNQLSNDCYLSYDGDFDESIDLLDDFPNNLHELYLHSWDLLNHLLDHYPLADYFNFLDLSDSVGHLSDDFYLLRDLLYAISVVDHRHNFFNNSINDLIFDFYVILYLSGTTVFDNRHYLLHYFLYLNNARHFHNPLYDLLNKHWHFYDFLNDLLHWHQTLDDDLDLLVLGLDVIDNAFHFHWLFDLDYAFFDDFDFQYSCYLLLDLD